MKPQRGRKVLIVEDNPLNLELLAAVLEGAGYVVSVASDARAGLREAKRMRPDAVLMDVQLPEMDGLEATRVLHSDPEMANIPVIAVTAHVKRDDEERCLAAGCALHIAKPVDTRALPALVAQVIERSAGEVQEKPAACAPTSAKRSA